MSFQEQWKKGHLFQGYRGKKANFGEKGGSKDNIVSLFPSFRQGNSYSCEQRRLRRGCTFESRLGLRQIRRLAKAFKISCATSNDDLCAIHASSVDSGESAHLRRRRGDRG